MATASNLKATAQDLSKRSQFSALDSVKYIWAELGLPLSSLEAVNLSGSGLGLPSSFKIGHLAQASIALSALSAALIYSLRCNTSVSRVTVPLEHAVIEFQSERLYTLNGQPPDSAWGVIGGFHKTSDGYVRIHDSFIHHRNGTKALLGLDLNASRDKVGAVVAKWKAVDLETAAFENKLVITALRSFEQWDRLPQAQAVGNFPVSIQKIADGTAGLPRHMLDTKPDKCLRGLRVLDLSRVIAAPVCGRTLAAHGADVLWVTSPNLPDQPSLDRDLARGKRTIRIDLETSAGRETLTGLTTEADVFIQAYRPGSLAKKGFSTTELVKNNPHGIICANLSAYGPSGPWSQNRGFDSLVQNCSGINVSEAEHYGEGDARPLPCQALDHAAGYFLALGINTALYRKATEGGSYQVDVSLAGVMKYLRNLGQYEGKTGFQCRDYSSQADVAEEYLETRTSGFGELVAVKHSASIEGVSVGWDIPPKPLGSDQPVWF